MERDLCATHPRSSPGDEANLAEGGEKAFARSGVTGLDWTVMEPDSEGDADLLRAHCAGDPHAFARLYDRYDRTCFQFIRRTLGPAHAEAAEDLHQETWIAISRTAASFDGQKASFPAWLFTIARHKVWDHFRRQKVAVLGRAQDDVSMTVPDPGPTPLEHVETREMAQRLIAAVEALPVAQRETFVMFAQSELSLEEIARATEVAVETARSRLRYARATLRQALARERSAHA